MLYKVKIVLLNFVKLDCYCMLSLVVAAQVHPSKNGVKNENNSSQNFTVQVDQLKFQITLRLNFQNMFVCYMEEIVT